MKSPKFNQTHVEIVEKRIVWQGYFKMVKYFFRHALFQGGTSEIIEREMFERGHAVAVIPYDPIRDEIVLIEQIRVGAFGSDNSPWLIEVVAGIIEPNEQAIDVAKRELLEETGLIAQSMDKVMSFLTSPGGTSERIDLYISQVDSQSGLDVAGLEHEGEDIRVLRMSVSEAIELLDQGLIINGPTVIALQWLARQHQALRVKWQNQVRDSRG